MSSFFSKKLDFPPNALILKDILSLFLMAEFQFYVSEAWEKVLKKCPKTRAVLSKMGGIP